MAAGDDSEGRTVRRAAGPRAHGGARVAEVLAAHRVPFLFTLCGGHISPILVAAKQRGIRVIDVRHEANAVFAADAVSRLTGIPGVAAVTAGPGVTNAITALKNAQLAHSPLVLIGGATATLLKGRGALQDIDQLAVVHSQVKWSARPRRLKDVAPAVEEAFEIAQRGLPGPVFVELAVDLLYDQQTVREWYVKKSDRPARNLAERALGVYVKGHLAFMFGGSEPAPPARASHPQPIVADGDAVGAAAAALASAERPLFVLGSQVTWHPSRVRELVDGIERLGVPTYLSGMARGLLGRGHTLQMRHKRREALREADVVLLAGVPCDFRLDYGSHIGGKTTLLSVNMSSDDLTKNRRPDVAAFGDPHDFLVRLAAKAEGIGHRGAWIEKLRVRDEEREEQIDALAGEKVDGVNPIALCRGVDRALADDSVIVGDGGDFVATASYSLSPRRPFSWLDPGVFGTLGVGAGFALAARLVRPSADVWLLYGDGAAGFSLMEIDTFVRHGLPVVAVIGNDAGWTQIVRDQVTVLGDDVGCRLLPTAYHEVGRALGGEGLLLDDPRKIDDTLGKALALSRKGRPVVVNARIGSTEFRKGSISI